MFDFCYNVRGSGGFRTDEQSGVEETPLREHKFTIGQTVYFTSRLLGHMRANSTYQVVRLLPSDGADYHYRIKNPREAFERVVKESQLDCSN